MAHNLDYNEKTQQYSFMSVKVPAWHNLGTIVQDYPTSREALAFAGLDFEVEKRPVFTFPERELEDKNILNAVEIPNRFATIRTDRNTPLGVVGKDYQVVQNVEAFSFFDEIVGNTKGVLYETAGAIFGGSKIFITAKLPAYIKVGKDDLIEQYIFLTNTHDGSGSIIAAFTPLRICCNNTLNAALRNCSNVVRIRHTANALDRLKEAHKLMGIVDTVSPLLEGIFNQWSKIRITDSELQELIKKAMAPSKEVLEHVHLGDYEQLSTVFKNTCDKIFEYAAVSPSQQLETTRGTLFGAYNAITGYYHNICEYRSDTAKINAIIYGGTAQQRGQTAFNLCDAFMKQSDFIIN